MAPDHLPTAPARSGGSFEIRSEARGPHWIAWIVRDEPDPTNRTDAPAAAGRPYRGIVLVAATREDAEARARQFAEQSSY